MNVFEGYKMDRSLKVHFQYLSFVFILFMYINSLYAEVNNNYKTDSVISYSHSVSVQWIGIVFHPKGGTYPERYIRKLDPKAYFVIEIGAVVGYEFRIFDQGFLKAAFALNLDCANVPAGFFHLGAYYQIINRNRHILNIGLGPTLVYREDWNQFPEYVGDEFFKDNVHGRWQYRFIIFGSLEYNYRISKRLLSDISIIPGGHLIMTFSFGLKYIF